MMEHDETQDLLGALALGAVTGAEWERARDHFDDCGDCLESAARLKAAVEMFPTAAREITPPPALRSRILATISETSPSPVLHSVYASIAAPRSDSPHRASWFPRPGWFRFGPQAAIAGAAVVFLVLAGWSKSVRGRLDHAESELNQTRTQLAGLGGGNIFATSLNSTNSAPSTRGNLVYMTQEKAGMLMVWNLPQPHRGKIYQVWGQLNGQIRSLGALTLYPDGNGFIYLPSDVTHLKAVMLTMEPEPFSPSPTGDILLEAKIQ